MSAVFSKYYNYLFLISIIFYNLFPKKLRPIYLLLFSLLFFYLISSNLVICIITTVVLIYLFALLLDKIENEKNEALKKDNVDKKEIKRKYNSKKKAALIIGIIVNVIFLFIFKYLKFFTININYLLDIFNVNYEISILKLIAPIGISFYTLQALSYLFDVYNGVTKAEKNIFKVGLFICFFPTIMEGPIVRYNDTAEALYEGKKITYASLTLGLQRIMWGLFKKIIIADRLNVLVKTVFNHYADYGSIIVFLGALAYTIMLYMDFSGAMDVVIGIGEIFNIKIPENFNQPFFSKNISEFWTRWHISLGKWFKDYIYYPISLTKNLKKLTLKLRKKIGNKYAPLISGTIALFVVWSLNGLWHGAGWTFLLFGMYHFVLISLGNITKPIFNDLYTKFNIQNSKILKVLQIIKTTFLVIIGELIFRATSVTDAFKMIKIMFTNVEVSKNQFLSLGLDFPDVLVLIVALTIIFVVGLLKERKVDIRKWIMGKNIIVRWLIYYALIFAIIIFGAYGPGYQPVDPLYADF